ncbi:MAG: selenium cofactor biosynthesis protein YqeC [Chloroflexi bacterium]|nr:selenium cofactor biosynthesis protein YqeC [Chloroflexota bacterium]
MRFAQAFDLVRGDVVAFVGAGGKTSLMVSLGYELAEAGWRVLATTTTQLARDQLSLFPAALPANTAPRLISRALNDKHFVLLHDEIRRGSVFGPADGWTRHVLDSVDSDILLVEADNSRGLPFKAPLDGEPRIPPETSLVVAVASLSALGAPLDNDHVYNPRAMIDRYGFTENSPVKSPWLAQVLRDEELGLRGVPNDARVMIFLNQTPERGYVRGRARMIARLSLQSERISAVALGSVRGAEPVYELQRAVGALVLAPSEDSMDKFEASLQPVDGGGYALASATEQLMRSRIDHIRLVTGCRASEVRQAVKHLGVKTVHNRAWKSGGLVSSIRVGLGSLPAHIAAVLLVPCQQTGIQPKLIYQLLSHYARCDGDFILPLVGRGWSQPILIARKYWAEILKMPRQCDLADIVGHFEDHVTFLEMGSNGICRSGELDKGRSPAGAREQGS